MRVYRIARKQYADLEGTGGLYSWGRWHKKGHRVIYTAESRALAAGEKLVHLANINFIPKNLVMIAIEIPETTIIEIPKTILVPGWDEYPYHNNTLEFGSTFLSNKSNLILKVPSVVIEEEYNYIINPSCPEILNCNIIKITGFRFDNQVFGLK